MLTSFNVWWTWNAILHIFNEVALYGIVAKSQYVHLKLCQDQGYISFAYAQKYHLKKGMTLKVKEPYKKRTYTFKISGVYHYAFKVSWHHGLQIIDDRLLKEVWEAAVRNEMSGFLPYYTSLSTIILLAVIGMTLVIGILFLEYHRIRHIPMEMALKGHE